MRYLALATDYDGTIATHGLVDDATLAALERLLGSGRKLILVTGRELEELKTIFPHLEMFEWIVAENGAQLYRPSNQESQFMGEPPPPYFVEELKRRGVKRINVGGIIVATWHPYETIVLETIRDLGLELQVIFNKDAVMVLPANVNKATGLQAALAKMGLSAHNVVGVGDAENDHAFLSMCGCSAAVDNALPAVKERADIVLRRDHGAGVIDLIDQIIAGDLAIMESRLQRHHLLLGEQADGTKILIPPYNNVVLIAGPSGSGKSTVATGLLERLGERQFQYCIIDPEGDFSALEGAIILGDPNRSPSVEEILQVLKPTTGNAVVNMVGMALGDRPTFFLTLMTRLLEMRASAARPHWIILDEAHHLLPTSWQPAALALPQQLDRLVLITVHPGEVSPPVLSLVKTLVIVGPNPQETIAEFCDATGATPPSLEHIQRGEDEVVAWSLLSGEVVSLRPAPSHIERRRHIRKYAEGELPPDRSFYFKGPEGKLNLRAQNLILFMQMADGVDDATWTFHLRQGDVSQWFTTAIKDRELSEEAKAIEADTSLSPRDSRQRIREAIEKRYTLPASSFLPMPGTDAKPKWS